MKLEDVKSRPRRERRICRANLRLYPSQMKFIDNHQLSVQAIFDKALDELGHVIPALEDIERIAYQYGSRRHTSRNKVNIRRKQTKIRRRR